MELGLTEDEGLFEKCFELVALATGLISYELCFERYEPSEIAHFDALWTKSAVSRIACIGGQNSRLGLDLIIAIIYPTRD